MKWPLPPSTSRDFVVVPTRPRPTGKIRIVKDQNQHPHSRSPTWPDRDPTRSAGSGLLPRHGRGGPRLRFLVCGPSHRQQCAAFQPSCPTLDRVLRLLSPITRRRPNLLSYQSLEPRQRPFSRGRLVHDSPPPARYRGNPPKGAHPTRPATRPHGTIVIARADTSRPGSASRPRATLRRLRYGRRIARNAFCAT